MPRVGDILNAKYQLLRQLGKGGMGVVFEAEHLELEKKVAIKMPSDELADDPVTLERFRREPRAVAKTGHPGIVDVYDIGLDDQGLPYVVMELLEGRTLGVHLAAEGPLDVSFAAYVIAQVLSALDAAHSKKIIHRDLKPDNVFLVEAGQRLPTVKILDFGTAKVIGGTGVRAKLTESGALLGTPFYMAPEQITENQELDLRVDIWAVGVLLYETLTGRLPFEAENVYALVHKVLESELRPPRELRPEIPDHLEAIILRALSRDRDDRYSSATSMLHALLLFLDDDARGRISLPGGASFPPPVDQHDEATEQTFSEGAAAPGEPKQPAKATKPRHSSKSESDSALQSTPLPSLFDKDTMASATRTKPPPRRRSYALPALIVAVIILAALLTRIITTADEDQTAAQVSPTTAAMAAASDGAETVPAEAGPVDRQAELDARPNQPDAARPQRFIVTFINVPEGALVKLGGATVTGRSVSFAPGTVSQRLELRLGSREFENWVEVDDDRTIDVAEELRTKGTERRVGPRSSGGPQRTGPRSERPTPQDSEPPPSTASSDGGDLNTDRYIP